MSFIFLRALLSIIGSSSFFIFEDVDDPALFLILSTFGFLLVALLSELESIVDDLSLTLGCLVLGSLLDDFLSKLELLRR